MESKIFVLLIIFGSFAFALIQRWMKVKGEAFRKQGAALDAETKAQIADLKDRIEVLERIVTDKRERLREKIDAL